MIYMLSANSKKNSLQTTARKCYQMSAYLFKVFQKIFCTLDMLCSLGHNGSVNLVDFCPGTFHTPGPLPCWPGMRSAEIAVFPVVNRWHFQIVIMDICQYLLMRPVRHRTVSRYPLSVGVNVIPFTNIISVGSPSVGKASADGRPAILYPALC